MVTANEAFDRMLRELAAILALDWSADIPVRQDKQKRRKADKNVRAPIQFPPARNPE